ncbi:ComF family protein [Burkholderia sp. 22PA0099]|uniref:ComF family protein n=1 Tax=Burkholderia sp. 22PA0099 TaxID=3237372 RepID=UPI0039C47057
MNITAVLRRSMSAGLAGALRMACRRAIAVALPNLCALCGNSSRNVLCEACDAAYWNESRLRCTQCALPLAARQPHRQRAPAGHRTDYRCDRCRTAPPPFDATLALADYRAPLDTLVLDLKFRARLAVGTLFGERLARMAADAPAGDPRPDVIVPAPLSRQRLVERGYNQAWAIAQPLARTLGVPADARLVARAVHTAPQSRLDEAARRANVARAFVVAGEVRGLHVGVVDDVMTSGATLDALAARLKAAGARRVTNYVALRTAKD